MHGELLHNAIDRRGKCLKVCSLFCLDHVLRQASGFLFSLGQLLEPNTPIFGGGLLVSATLDPCDFEDLFSKPGMAWVVFHALVPEGTQLKILER